MCKWLFWTKSGGIEVWFAEGSVDIPVYGIPPSLYLFSQLSTFDNIFYNIAPMKQGINAKLSLWKKVISTCLEEYKINLHVFKKATPL